MDDDIDKRLAEKAEKLSREIEALAAKKKSPQKAPEPPKDNSTEPKPGEEQKPPDQPD